MGGLSEWEMGMLERGDGFLERTGLLCSRRGVVFCFVARAGLGIFKSCSDHGEVFISVFSCYCWKHAGFLGGLSGVSYLSEKRRER